MSYFGLYKDLMELNIPDSVSQDLYERTMARYYDKITEIDKYDIEIFYKYAAILGDQVLELACGSGRVAIPLAEKGFQVIGIDFSSDMLAILDKKLLAAPSRVKKRITTYKCDMTNFSIDRTFRLVILPGTSISLLVRDEQIRSMFKCVYAHMESGGRFVFDYWEPDSIINSPVKNETHCYTWDNDSDGKEFVIFSEFVDISKSRLHINFYAEQIKDGATKRFFGSSEKRLIYDDVIELARSEKLNLLDTFTLECSPTGKIKFVVLEKW